MGQDLVSPLDAITLCDAVDAGACVDGVFDFIDKLDRPVTAMGVADLLAVADEFGYWIMRIARRDGDGYGSGLGYGYGDGYGSGLGHGYGDGDGYGYRDGCGGGYGDGNGDGSGGGYGLGYGYGDGDEYGDGYERQP